MQGVFSKRQERAHRKNKVHVQETKVCEVLGLEAERGSEEMFPPS